MSSRVAALCVVLFASPPATAETPEDHFELRVRPLLHARCVKCHGPEQVKGGLRLDTAEHFVKGGESGPAVVPGDPGRSLLVEAVRGEGGLQMPPDAKLSSEEVAVLVAWIEGGATWPGYEPLATGGDPPSVPDPLEPDAAALAPHLQAWYKADSLHFQDGEAVYLWADSSGHGRDLSPTKGSRAGGTGTPPTFTAAGTLNQRPAVRFGEGDGLARYLSTGEARVLGRRIELSAVRKGGERFDCELSITRNPGEPPTFTGFLRDVTERKRVERRQRFLADLAAAAQSLTDPKEVTATTARMLAEHLGCDRCAYAEVEGEAVFVITGDFTRGVPSIVGRWPVAAFGPECTRRMLANEPYVVVDAEADPRIGPDDLPAYEATNIRAVVCVPLHKAGQFTAAMAVHQKTSRRWTPEEIELVRTVVGRCWEALERATLVESLRDRDRRKDEFLATLAHELRNPLAPIRSGLAVLRLGLTEANAETVVPMMERQVVHLVRLVDDLLDVSRVTTGRIALRAEQVDFREAVEAAVETARPCVAEAGHRLDVRLPAEPLPVEGDRARLTQVVANLLNNACKYTPEGGRVEVSAGREDGAVVLRVADTGVGIPPEMLSKVFDVFTQVGRSLDRSQGGLGIGLALVRRLVEMHGGTVQADSPGPGGGSTFTVRLPLSTAERPVGPLSAAGPGRGTEPLARRRVLVVDDAAPSANLLAMLLKGLGQETRAAYDGPSALKAVAEFRPDVVISDVAMPGMNGYEVARRIRATDGFSPVLVALTGYGQEEDRRLAFQAGFDHHLVKPTSVDDLRRILASLPTS